MQQRGESDWLRRYGQWCSDGVSEPNDGKRFCLDGQDLILKRNENKFIQLEAISK